MTKEELAQRWLAGISGITTDQQRLGNIAADEWGRLVEAQQYLATLPIALTTNPASASPRCASARAGTNEGLASN